MTYAFEKDCNCQNHTVPHWLYMDAFDALRAQETIDRANALSRNLAAQLKAWHGLIPNAFAVTSEINLLRVAAAREDLPRLAEKKAWMTRLRIDVIPADIAERARAEASVGFPKRPPLVLPEPRPIPQEFAERAKAAQALYDAERDIKAKTRLAGKMRELEAEFKQLTGWVEPKRNQWGFTEDTAPANEAPAVPAEPPPARPEAELKEEIRSTALALETAVGPKAKEKYRRDLDSLDAEMRRARPSGQLALPMGMP